MLNEETEELLEETEENLFGMTYRIMKAADWSKQNKLIILERRFDTQRLERENKIKEYETRIKLIKYESKIEREDAIVVMSIIKDQFFSHFYIITKIK